MKIVEGRVVADDYDDEPVELICENCRSPFDHSGPGRRPKKCPNCRSAAKAPTRGGTRGIEALREPLINRYFALAQAMAMVHPAYGLGIRLKAEAAADADIEYAKVNPAFRRFLQGTVEKTAAAAVIAVHAEMFKPIAVREGVRLGVPFMAKRRPASAPQPRMRVVPDEPAATPPPESSAQETVNAGAMPGMPA